MSESPCVICRLPLEMACDSACRRRRGAGLSLACSRSFSLQHSASSCPQQWLSLCHWRHGVTGFMEPVWRALSQMLKDARADAWPYPTAGSCFCLALKLPRGIRKGLRLRGGLLTQCEPALRSVSDLPKINRDTRGRAIASCGYVVCGFSLGGGKGTQI